MINIENLQGLQNIKEAENIGIDGPKSPIKSLTMKEKKVLQSVLTGKIDINGKKAQEYLNRPHVAVSLEAVLDTQGLTDEKLSDRLREIIYRKECVSINPKTGSVNTNIVGIDANALNTIRTIWQVKGKFTEKVELKTPMAEVPEADLDNIINSGYAFLRNKKDTLGGNN